MLFFKRLGSAEWHYYFTRYERIRKGRNSISFIISFFLLKLWTPVTSMPVVLWVAGCSSKQIYVSQAVDSALAAECWGSKYSLKLLEKSGEKSIAASSWWLCAAVRVCMIHCLNPQGKGTVHIFFMQSREAAVGVVVMTSAALPGSSAFQLFPTVAGTDCGVHPIVLKTF